MEPITIWLSRNKSEQDWSVEIDGSVHRHISTRTLDDLVEYTLLVAQETLLETEASTDSSETVSVSDPSD
jgi:hypothetical protein